MRARWLAVRLTLVVATATAVLGTTGGTAGALPTTTTPKLTLNRIIRTTPFTGTSSSMRDNEGSAFVPNDPAHPNIGGTDSLWLVEDNGKAIWEINPYTGQLKSSVQSASWQATKQYNAGADSGTGSTAGSNRDPDLEAGAYDASTDTLYVFNGKCCTSSVLPTAYRLKRGADHTFHPESWQPLPSGTDFTAADWNARDNKLYVGVSKYLRTYDYRTNTAGPTFSISGVSSIYGLGFSADGTEMYVASKVHVLRVDWVNRKLMTGWDIDLTPFGVKDSRSVEVINDQFYVGDGYDGRSTSDPLRDAVFVFDVCCGSSPAPVASFTTAQAASPDLTINFTDTSTNSPTSWAWDFDNNGTTDSTLRNPQHTFPTAGDFTVKLTATNGTGPGSVTRSVHVDPPATPQAPTANFSFATGAAARSVQFTDTSTGGPTSWAWTFGDGATSTQASPLHTFPAAGGYTVTLTATNAQGSTSATKSVTVSDAPVVTTFTPNADSYVSWSSPTKNYATYTDLKILANNGSYEYHPYFQFAVSGLSGAPSAAKLRLFVTDGGTRGGNWFTTTAGWVETAINWGNAPAITGSPFASLTGAVTAGQWIEIDVTSKITGNGTFSFAGTTTATDTVAFASRESANAPQLVVTR